LHSSTIGGPRVPTLINQHVFLCVHIGLYQYTSDLQSLDRARDPGRLVPPEMRGALKLENWESILAGHPDDNRLYIICGAWASVRTNMFSAQEHPELISDYLEKERERGVLLGPFGAGVIPKSNQPELIVDLSSPEGKNVNDGIDSSRRFKT